MAGASAQRTGTQRCRIAGFTLLELMVAVTIFALLTGMVMVNLGTFVPSARLEGSGNQIRSKIDYIRSEARIRGREMSIELDLDRARWQIIYPPDIRLTLDQDQDTLEEYSLGWNDLEDGVVFGGAGDSKNGLATKGPYRVRFDEYGFSNDQVIVLRLEQEPDQVWSLTLRGLTGATSVSMSTQGEEAEMPYVGEGAF